MLTLGVLVSAVCVYLVSRSISIEDVRRSLRSADYAWLVPTVLVTLLTGWLRAIRWRVLFAEPEKVSRGQAFGALSIGLMFNNLLPSRAGEVPRLLALRRATGLSASEVGMTIVVERMLDVFVLALAGLVLWPWLPDRAWIDALGLLCAGIALGFLVLGVMHVRFRRQMSKLLVSIVRRAPLVSDERAEAVRVGTAAGTKVLVRSRPLLKALALSFVVWAAVGLSAWTLFPAFDLETGAVAAGFVMVANSFALVVPAGPATVGVYEASIQAALVAFGVSSSVALSYALLLHAVNFFPIILIGAVASVIMGRPHAKDRVTG